MNDPRESMEGAPLLGTPKAAYSNVPKRLSPASLPTLSLPAEQVGSEPGFRGCGGFRTVPLAARPQCYHVSLDHTSCALDALSLLFWRL